MPTTTTTEKKTNLFFWYDFPVSNSSQQYIQQKQYTFICVEYNFFLNMSSCATNVCLEIKHHTNSHIHKQTHTGHEWKTVYIHLLFRGMFLLHTFNVIKSLHNLRTVVIHGCKTKYTETVTNTWLVSVLINRTREIIWKKVGCEHLWGLATHSVWKLDCISWISVKCLLSCRL